jgi:hypothetical protein
MREEGGLSLEMGHRFVLRKAVVGDHGPVAAIRHSGFPLWPQSVSCGEWRKVEGVAARKIRVPPELPLGRRHEAFFV